MVSSALTPALSGARAAVALGVAVLTAVAAGCWLADVRLPDLGLGGRTATTPALVLLAAGVLLRPGRTAARAAGIAALVVAVLTASGADPAMPRNAALVTALLGFGLAVHPWRAALPAAALAGVIAAVALLGYATGETGLAGGLPPVDAAPLGLVALAVVLAPPTSPHVALLLARGLGGELARRLVPVALLLPLGLAALDAVAARAGLVGDTAGDWLVAVGAASVFGWTAVHLAGRAGAADEGRRAVLEELSAAERSARSVTETASDAIVQADDAGTILSVNLAAERLFGHPAADLVGRSVSVLLPERLRAAHEAGILRHGPAGAPHVIGRTIEVTGRHADGFELPIELSLATFEHDGRPRYTAIMRDVSGRRAAEERAAEDARRLQQALDTQLAVAAARDAQEIAEVVVRRAAAAVDGDGAVVDVPDGDDLVARAVTGLAAAERDLRVPVSDSLAGLALRTGATQVCDDSEADARVDRGACRRVGLRSMICVPLVHEGRVVAVLDVVSADPHAFGDRERRTLELLAGIAGGAIARAQAEERLRAHRIVGEAVAAAATLEDGLAGALEGLGTTLGWDAGVVWLAHGHAERLESVATWQRPDAGATRWLDRSRAVPLLRGEGVPGRVWAGGEPVWLDDLQADEDDFRVSAVIEAGLRTLVCVPLMSDGAVIGALTLASRRREAPDSARTVLLTSLAAQLGQFAQRSRAERRVAEQAADLRATVELAGRLQTVEDPAQAREVLTRAVRAATRADAVLLVERTPDGELVAGAQVGLDLRPGDAFAGDLLSALLVGDTVLLDDVATGLPFLPAAAGLGVRTALLQPMREGSAALLVGWHDLRVDRAERVRSLMPLVAAEASAALERADLLAALRASARTDQLTGLANRRAWDEGLPNELARARRSGEPLAVALFDLDHFKRYNDTYGHPAGDRLLRDSASAWRSRLRSTDLIARYGGEEFAVALPGCSADAALAVLEALRGCVPGGATCSIGVAEWDGSEDPEALVARADEALYAAKARGRDRVERADTRPRRPQAPAPQPVA